MKKPITLLEEEVEKLIRARNHSIKSYKKGDISEKIHDTHLANLTPMIEEYKYIIRVIDQYA